MGFLLITIASVIYPFIDVVKKRATGAYTVPIIFWGVTIFSLPVYLILLIREGIPSVDPWFWLIVSVDIPLLILTNILLIKDEKIAPISTTLPLLSFSPVFLIGTSYLFLGEMPNTIGIIGIFLVVAGAVLLKGEEVRKSLMLRLKHIFSQRASIYILIIALIWSFNANFAKMAMQKSSPVFYLFIVTAVEFAVLSIWLMARYRSHFDKMISFHVSYLVSAGILTAVANVIFLIGLETTYVSYAIAIKRALLIIGSIVLGAIYFKERNIKYRIAGAAVMMLGMVFILAFH